jgi:ferredoxin-NADP reductase
MTVAARDRRPTRPAASAASSTMPSTQPAASQAIVLAVIAAGALATIALWWNDTTAIHGFGDWLTNAGRVTGLLAGYGVVVLVALMARIPPLERGIGADQLARWHAHGGRYVVSLVVAHGLLIIWGYAVTAHTNVVSQTATLLTSYPDVLMASVAGLLLVGIGIVSARAARRRMRYETNRPVRVAWSALYIAVAAAIAWYRLTVPVWQAIRHQMRVVAVYPEAPGVTSIVISGQHLDELQAQSGQFFRWRFLTRDLWWASNPYSLSAAPRPDWLRITVKDFGEHSSALARLRPGTRVFAEGPYGAMTAIRRRRRKVLLIAGGIGITPLRALFETLPGGKRDITLIYRAGHNADTVFRDELVAIAHQRGAQLHIVTGHRSELGYDPLSKEALMANVPDLRSHDVYVCGPDPMAESVVAALREVDVPRRQIHHESFEF